VGGALDRSGWSEPEQGHEISGYGREILRTEDIRQLRALLHGGLAIPAHPLALDGNRKLDERRQRALTRYYAEAGAGGLAVGVHTTQFSIRQKNIGLYEPVLGLAMEEMRGFERRAGKKLVKVGGVCGATRQACAEAAVLRDLGYDTGLLSLAALPGASDAELIAHCRAVGEILPLMGFYLQPAVGGRPLDYDFWRRFSAIENVIAIKIAPFNRYQTIDVVRAVAASGRATEIALYTGNDDNIVGDLATQFRFGEETLHFAGGLLGQWAVWTKRAVELLEEIKCKKEHGEGIADLLARGTGITDANAAIFDARNNFRGCISGIHEILRRQGLVAGRWCLDPEEELSAGQLEEIDRVCFWYPHLNDDAFVAENLDRWLN
jgi:dihydrodipicolinate synthase/N-acetylneuraminate lyase